MLFFKKPMLLLVLCLTVAAAKSQVGKTAVFEKFSTHISINESTLRSALSGKKGQAIDLSFGEGLQLDGEIISNTQVYDNLQTVIVRSAAYKNALIQVSKQINPDHSINYVGRIFSPGAADGYEIKKSEDGRYSLQKFETATILQDCNMQ